MAHPVTHFEVNARDARAAQRFYGDLFGWKIDTSNPSGYGMVTAGGEGHGIGGGIGATQNGQSWITFYVETPDLAKTLAKAEQLGGRTVMPPMEMGPVEYALFADPEGNVIGIAKSSDHQPTQRPKRRTATRRAAGRSTARKATARKRTSTKRAVTKRPARRTRGR